MRLQVRVQQICSDSFLCHFQETDIARRPHDAELLLVNLTGHAPRHFLRIRFVDRARAVKFVPISIINDFDVILSILSRFVEPFDAKLKITSKSVDY
jgi:hypothetical protein